MNGPMPKAWSHRFAHATPTPAGPSLPNGGCGVPPVGVGRGDFAHCAAHCAVKQPHAQDATQGAVKQGTPHPPRLNIAFL